MGAKGIGPLTPTLPTLESVELIKRDILNLLLTRKGERPMRASLGIGLWGLLFEPLDDISMQLTRDQIIEQLRIYEPRVQVTNIAMVDQADDDPPSRCLTIQFRLKSDPTYVDLLRIPVEGVGGNR